MSRWKERKAEEDASLGQLGEDFAHARPMWNSEVTFILRNFLQEQQHSTSPDSALSPPQRKVLTDTLHYAESLNQYANPDSVNAAHALTEKYELSEWEMAVINNCKIDDVDECLTLLPAVRAKVDRGEIEREKIEELLAELKRFQSQ